MINSALFGLPAYPAPAHHTPSVPEAPQYQKAQAAPHRKSEYFLQFCQRRKVKDFFIKFIKSKVGNPLQIPDLRFLSKGSSHLPHFVFQHTLDFIAHGFRAGGAEMDANLVSGLSNLPHQCRGVLLRLNGRCAGRIFNSHILQGSFLQGIRSALPPFSLPPRFPLGSSFRQRE